MRLASRKQQQHEFYIQPIEFLQKFYIIDIEIEQRSHNEILQKNNVLCESSSKPQHRSIGIHLKPKCKGGSHLKTPSEWPLGNLWTLHRIPRNLKSMLCKLNKSERHSLGILPSPPAQALPPEVPPWPPVGDVSMPLIILLCWKNGRWRNASI